MNTTRPHPYEPPRQGPPARSSTWLATWLVWASTSCAAPAAAPESGDAYDARACDDDGGEQTLARCEGEGGAGATVCMREAEGEGATLRVTWSTGGATSAQSWSGDALAAVRWSRDSGRAHVNATIGWTDQERGEELLLTLHTRLATETSPARHAGALRVGPPTRRTVRCRRLAPHDPLPLQTTPARRIPWAPGW